jgi:hypothetical protein
MNFTRINLCFLGQTYVTFVLVELINLSRGWRDQAPAAPKEEQPTLKLGLLTSHDSIQLVASPFSFI